PDPSDFAGLRLNPKNISSNMDCARRTVCSAEMLTTAGATLSTTSTTSLRREGRGAPKAAGTHTAIAAAAGHAPETRTTARKTDVRARGISPEKENAPQERGALIRADERPDYLAWTSIALLAFSPEPEIGIWRGLASSRLGSSISRSPLSNRA